MHAVRWIEARRQPKQGGPGGINPMGKLADMSPEGRKTDANCQYRERASGGER